MIRYLVLAVFFSLAALAGSAWATDAEFSKMDKNGDGRVSKEEFLRWYPVEVWRKVDAPGKGYIKETEWIPVRESLRQYRRQEARDAEVGR